MRLFARLLLGAVGVLALTALVLLSVVNRELREQLEQAFIQELEAQARVVAQAVSARPENANLAAPRLGALIDRRVTLIGADGTVLGDTDFDDASLALLDNQGDRPEVRAALEGRTGIARRLSGASQRVEIMVAIPAWPGAVRVAAPLDQVDALVGRNVRTVGLATLAALILGAALLALGSRAIARSVTALTRAVQAAAGGGTPRYPHSGIPEVTELVRAVRSMHEQLAARIGELRRERGETEALLESMVEGVIATDARGRVVVCNAATRRLLGFGPADHVPNLRELFHQRDARDIVERAFAGQSVHGQDVEVGGRSVLATARPLPDGGVVLGLLDITDLKRLQAVRRDFVANVSHELRTPLTSIHGYAETLLAEPAENDTRRRFLRAIYENSNRMRRLVDDLLDLARLEAGGWHPSAEPVTVAVAVTNAWSGFARDAERKGVAFVCDAPAGFQATVDVQALRQILQNLFDNALRHTPEGGTITVTARRVGDEAEIAVADSGSGIPAVHVERVFERFYRVDPGRSREEGGTGLGLAIVKHLVESHGGRVTLESAVGRGTTVRMLFPSVPRGA